MMGQPTDTVRITLDAVDLSVPKIEIDNHQDDEKLLLLQKNPPLVNLADRVNLIPGVNSMSGASNTAKYSFRGFGARSQYTTSKGSFYLGELPLAGMQGFTTFEDINPIIIDRLEFNSTGHPLYPSSIGGVMRLSPKNIDVRGRDNEIGTSLSLGSFGLMASNTFYGHESNADKVMVNYENSSKDGWRDNSQFKRQSFYLYDDGSINRHFSLLLYALTTKSHIPSSLSQTDFELNPTRAASSWDRIAGFEQYDKLITGITYKNVRPNEKQNEKLLWSVTGFYTFRNGFEPRPFNILDDKSHHGGLRGTLKRRLNSSLKSEFSAFVEYHLGRGEMATFQNRFDSIANTYNNKGDLINGMSIWSQRTNGALSYASNLAKGGVLSKWSGLISMHWLYQYTSLQSQSQAAYDLPFTLAPRLRLSYNSRGKRNFVWAFNTYRSTSIPSLEENIDPNGEVNAGLLPELAWTAESNLSFRCGYINYGLNLYYSLSENLIVPRVIAQDQVVATNSGKSRHMGVEAFANFKYPISTWLFPARWQTSWQILANYGHFNYTSFSDTTGVFDGNQLPGVPNWAVLLSGDIKIKKFLKPTKRGGPADLSLGFLLRGSDGYFIDDENTQSNKSFWLLQTWLGYKYGWFDAFELDIKVGLRNVTDTHYASMTVVNNRAFGNSEPRYYYPGEPLNWFTTIKLSYRF